MPLSPGKFEPRDELNRVTKLAIVLRDGARCLICLTPVSELRATDITIDHVLPRILGRKTVLRRMWRGRTEDFPRKATSVNDSRNVYTCCRPCTSRRKQHALSHWASAEAYERVKTACLTPLPREQARAVVFGTIETTR